MDHSSTMSSEISQNSRINALDGMRGLAILLVVTFHTYSHWESLIPWTSDGKLLIFKYGNFGVELFFLISGFVIYMTLEKTKSFQLFILHRWLRLFPAMLAATALIYGTSFYLKERPFGEINPIDVLPGLLLMDITILNKAQSFFQFKAIEGSFWSLYVEIKFYLIFGSLYFLDKKTALRNLIVIFLLSYVIKFFELSKFTTYDINYCLFDVLSLQFFGSFCVGAILFKALTKRDHVMLLFSFIMMFPTLLIVFSKEDEMIVGGIFYMIFVFALYNRFIARFFENKYLVLLGFISYPLYLIHENALIAFTIKTHQIFPNMPAHLTSLPGLALILMLSFLISKYFEPNAKKLLRKLLD